MTIDPPVSPGETFTLIGGGVPGPPGAGLGEHESAEDPHSQYATREWVESETTPTSVDLTLSAAAPTVPELSNVNEWTVSGPLQVTLPVVPDGAQYTVHVKSGFQNLTWPNGTTVYGETDQQDVWVTLIRGNAGWNVLIPSPAAEPSAAGLDTGWVNLAAGYNFGGTTTWTVNPGASLGAGWGILLNNIGFISIRRTGNTLHIRISGMGKINTTSSILIQLPSGIQSGTNTAYGAVAFSHSVSEPNSVTMLRINCLNNAVDAVAINGSILPEGTIVGKTSGGNVYGAAMLSFPIEPFSTWGT